MQITPNEIHLWFTFPNEIDDPALLDAYEQLMNSEEKERHRRFRFEKDRHSFLVTRALIRTTLSQYADVEPAQWQFSKNEYGKPEILSPEISLPLRFNLSHTKDLIACAVVLEKDIGIDVEDTHRKTGGIKLARRFFSKKEVEDLLAVEEEKQREFFFNYWTLKESYIKARGMGLSLPLAEFSFDILNKTSISICFHSGNHEKPDQWLFCPTKQHRGAISVRKEGMETDFKILVQKAVPLVSEEDFGVKVLKRTAPSKPYSPNAVSLSKMP